MLTLYTNLLHGTTPAFTGPEVKEIVFKSFPFSWQQDYELSGRDFNAQQLPEIVDYFGTLKVKKDQDETRKRHGGGRGSPGRGGFEHRRGGGGRGGREDAAAEDLITSIAAAEVSSRIRIRITRTITAQTFRIKVTIRVVVFDRITISIVTRTEDSAEDKTTFKAEGHQDEFQQVEYLNKIIIIFITRGDERLQRQDRLKQRDCQRYEQWDYSTEQNDYQQTQDFEQQTPDYELQHYEQDQDQQGWY